MSKKIVFVGGGNMAEAVLSGLLVKKTVSSSEVLVSEINCDRCKYLENTYHIETTQDNSLAPQHSKTLFLAVKPQKLHEVKIPLKQSLTSDHLVISILAGTSREKLGNALGFVDRMVRVMPNLPAQVGRGVSAISFPETLPEQDRDWVRNILRSVGEIVEVEESLQDAVTAVSGSGPGYLFYMVDVLIQAAINQGLQEDVARTLVVETLAGTAQVLCSKKDTPSELVKKVATPGGTTEAGLSVLKENRLDILFEEMIQKATQRSIELNRC